VDAVAVELAGEHVRQVRVPDLVGLLRERQAVRFRRRARGIEQAQLDLRGVLGEKREVDPRAIPGGTLGRTHLKLLTGR
jgi:hypothetical protein